MNLNIKKYKAKYKNLKGGLLNCPETKNYNFEKLIQDFESCKIFSTNSLYGFNWIFETDAKITKFISGELSNLGNNISNFLVKFSLIDKEENSISHPGVYGFQLADIGMTRRPSFIKLDRKNTCNEEGFIREIQIQNNIYINSCKTGYPICPPLLTAKIFNNQQAIDILMTLINSSKLDNELSKTISNKPYNTQEVFKLLVDILQANTTYRLGVVVMEFMKGYKTLSQYLLDKIETPDKQSTAVAHSLYQNLRLIGLGYKHSDLHMENILFCENVPSDNDIEFITKTIAKQYDISNMGRAILIDFGRTEPYTNNIQNL